MDERQHSAASIGPSRYDGVARGTGPLTRVGSSRSLNATGAATPRCVLRGTGVASWVLACALAMLQVPAAVAEEHQGIEVGRLMADFGLRRLDLQTGALGKLVWLSDYVGPTAKQRKKLVLLSFFAPWCKPCMEEADSLISWQDEWADHGLQVVAVNYRGPKETWQEAVSQTRRVLGPKGPRYPLLFDKYTNRNQLLYMGARAVLPCNVLLDGETGVVVGRFQGASEGQVEELERAVRARLGEGS